LAGGLDGDAFLIHLAEVVGPIVNAVAEILPECSRSVAVELYDLSLELFASQTMGPQATSAEILRVWNDILPHLPKLMSRDAAVVAGSLSNAAFNVARADTGRIDFWLEQMLVTARVCDNLPRLLDCGTVLAWRAGMVQYRSAAMDAAAALPHVLAITALGLAENTGVADLQALLAHLRQSPWHCLESTIASVDPQPHLVRTIGDFRGFGGQFLRPPRVTSHNDDLLATDGQSTWRLLVDCYGSMLQRIGGRDAFPHRRTHRRDDRVTHAQEQLPELAKSASSASLGNTVAITFDDSHRIVIVAVP
jgi:hypothetical protein